MKKIIIILLSFILLTGCTKEQNNIINKTYLENISNNKKYIILDVRTKEEYQELHIKDSINIPLNEITEKTELDKEKIIFVYCRSGNRSNKAYNILTNLGYEVHDLGGIDTINLDKE